MNLPGYAERMPDDSNVAGLTFDGEDLTALPGFWAAQLGSIVDDEDVLVEAWELPAEVIRAAYRRLSDEAAWPVFGIALADDARLVVVYRNFYDDAGKDFLLLPGGDRPGIEIASIEGHQRGPGLSWAELTAVAGRQDGPVAQARAMLLLVPVLGDEEAESDEARAVLAEALRTLGATGPLDALIEALVSENVFFGPAGWSTVDGVVVCDMESCPRNPADRSALKPDDLRTVSDLLAGTESG